MTTSTELHSQWCSAVSDAHKEVYNVRPRFYVWSEMSIEDLEAEYESLCQVMCHEDEVEAEAFAAFAAFAPSESDAQRWMDDAAGVNDHDYF